MSVCACICRVGNANIIIVGKKRDIDMPSMLMDMINGGMLIINDFNCAGHRIVLVMKSMGLWNVQLLARPLSTK